MKLLTEQTILELLRNPDTSASSRTFRFAGKVDLILERDDGSLEIIDWKCCGNVEDTARTTMVSFQADLYAWGANQTFGGNVDAVRFHLITRPSIKFCGKDNGDVTTYEERCMDWLAQPGKLKVLRVAATPERQHMALAWLWSVGQKIIEARSNSRFLQNCQACDHWGRECPYMDLCIARSQGLNWRDIAEDAFVVKYPHPELSLASVIEAGSAMMSHYEEEKGSLLTFSSASLFSLCERKYEWRVERSLVQRSEETTEALEVGINVHEGLDKAFSKGLKAGLDAVTGATLGIDTKRAQDEAKTRAIVRTAFREWGGLIEH